MPGSAALAVSKFITQAVVVPSPGSASIFGIKIGTTVALGVPAAGLICYDTTKNALVARIADSAGAAAAVVSVVPVAAGIITVAAGSTSGTATVPAGLSLATCRMESSIAGSATTAVVSTAPLFTLSGTTLTVTVTDPAAATSVYISYAIYKA